MAEEVRTVDDDAKPDEGPNWMSDEEVKTAATELNAALCRTQRGEHEGCPSSRRGLSPGRCGPVPYTRSSIQSMTHEQALAAVRATLEAAAGPVSIAVVDDHGDVVACLAMDGAARDTLENARRKAYTAARSDATSTRALAAKVEGSPTELASFDPQFSFFHGGVAAFAGGRRVGAVGVSGLPGADDEKLAIAAVVAAGLVTGI